MDLTSNKRLCSVGRRAIGRLGCPLLMAGVLWVAGMGRAGAAVSTTTVQGTVYLANGEAGSGMLHVSWPAFTSANGEAVVADSADVTIGQDGFLSVNLAPNQGAMPAGLYYTAVFYMNDGSVSTQYWVVPSAAQTTLAQVQAQVMPAAQAVQAVNKAYVDQAIVQLSQSMLTGSGGTLTGPLFLSGDPTQPLQAADKHYVDLATGQASSGSVNPASPGQIAYYLEDGKSISGISSIPLAAGGTGSTTAGGALQNLGGISAISGSAQTMAGPLNLSGPYDSSSTDQNQAASAENVGNVAPRSVKEFGAKGNGLYSDFKMEAGSNVVELVDWYSGLDFAPGDVGKLIMLPKVDSDHQSLYTTITGYTDHIHITVATNATYAFDGTGTGVNQALWGTDDLAAIQAGLVSITSGRPTGEGDTRDGGGSLIFPCGYYIVSGQIQIPGGINLEGVSRGCAVIVDMGTTAHDATVELSNPSHSTWLVNGLYMNPAYNNHPEIGACSGATCSPDAPDGGSTGSIKNLTIYANKYASWGFAELFTYNYLSEGLTIYSGNKGCFYQLSGVQITHTQMLCGPDIAFGHGAPVNGIYLDGTAPGQGADPEKIQSAWVTDGTGTAFTANLVGQVTVADSQISDNHQSINLMANSGGITMEGGLLEGGASGQIADVIASNNNLFENVSFTGTGGVTVSGYNNVFKASGFSGGQTLTITGANNTFENATLPANLTITDTSRSSKYTSTYDSNSGLALNRPASEVPAQYDSGVAGFEPPVKVSGQWGASTTPADITNAVFTTGQAWKAIITGDWYDYAMVASMPHTIELTDTANTVTAGGRTYTFSIGSSGHFQVVADGSDHWQRFSGYILFIPRAGSSGSGGTNSVKYAGTVQAPGVQVSTGSTLTGNQGNGSLVQHSTGGTTTSHLAMFDANGNVVDAGAGMPSGTIASGTLTLATSAISAGSCQSITAGSVNSAAATGVLTTDTVTFTPNGSIKAVTGFTPGTSGGLTVTAYPTAGYVNFDVCNWSAASITPGAVTLNWKVTR
jgi:hypothetical protein